MAWKPPDNEACSSVWRNDESEWGATYGSSLIGAKVVKNSVLWVAKGQRNGEGTTVKGMGLASLYKSLKVSGFQCSIKSPNQFLFQNHPIIPLSFSFFVHLSLCVFLCFAYMDKPERSFKTALLSQKKSSNNPPSMAEEADGVIGALDSSDSAEEAMDEFSSENEEESAKKENNEESDAEFNAYVEELSKVEKDIKMLEETCLIGTLWRGNVEIMRLKQKLIAEWSFVKGGIEVVDRANNWFEIQFGSAMDKELVWECRPYHIFGLLLVLMPWKPNFDPSNEDVVSVELWVRILALPTEYMSFDMIQAILKYNKIGALQKLDIHTENRSRAKYARVCVKIKYAPTLKGHVMLPNLKNTKEKKILKLWYEGVSEGCINCAEKEHQFSDCPLRAQMDRNVKIMVEKYKGKGMVEDDDSKTKMEKDQDMDEGWTKVVDRKGKKPMVESYKPKVSSRRPSKARKRIQIFDLEQQQEENKKSTSRGDGEALKNGQSGHEGCKTQDASMINSSTSSDAVVPSISRHKMNVETHGMNASYPKATADMAGMDQSIFEFCGGLPLGTIHEEGGYLLQDVITGYNGLQQPVLHQLAEEVGDDTDTSYKSTQSKTSMIQKMGNMKMRKDDTSMTDSGKRRIADAEEDTATSVAKKARNTEP